MISRWGGGHYQIGMKYLDLLLMSRCYERSKNTTLQVEVEVEVRNCVSYIMLKFQRKMDHINVDAVLCKILLPVFIPNAV